MPPFLKFLLEIKFTPPHKSVTCVNATCDFFYDSRAFLSLD